MIDTTIQDIEVSNVYNYLQAADWYGRPYVEAATRLAQFRPIFPGDREWQSLVQSDDQVTAFMISGMKVIGIRMGGKCIGFCGYRMLSEPKIIVTGRKAELPYELLLAIDDDVEITTELVYSAQMYIASRENLKVVQTIMS